MLFKIEAVFKWKETIKHEEDAAVCRVYETLNKHSNFDIYHHKYTRLVVVRFNVVSYSED